MTDQNAALLIIVLDRSGSMESIKGDMEGGFQAFIAEQKKVPGTCKVSLYQFDSNYDVVYEDRPLDEVPQLSLVPRSSTALLDAIGRTINTVGERLSKIPEDQRPGAVVFMIITDGRENASREFTYPNIKGMIEHQTKEYHWQFAYLGADIATFEDGQKLGINVQSVGQFQRSAQGVGQVYKSSGKGIADYRRAVSGGIRGAVLNVNIPPAPKEKDK